MSAFSLASHARAQFIKPKRIGRGLLDEQRLALPGAISRRVDLHLAALPTQRLRGCAAAGAATVITGSVMLFVAEVVKCWRVHLGRAGHRASCSL